MATTPPDTTSKTPSRAAQFGRDIVSEAKKKAVRGIGEAAFGTGVIGGALRKSYEKRFLKSDEDNRVETALQTQSNQLDQNNATLTRIEGIVLNISDNIYNLAGVWSNHVSSMEEARREQAERLSREKAAEEESAREVSKVDAPTAASTTVEKKDGGSILSKITGASKGLFGNFMKKFAIVAGVAAVGAGAAAAASGSEIFDDETPDAEEDVGQAEEQPSDQPELVPTPPGETPKTMITGGAPTDAPLPSPVPPEVPSVLPVPSASPAPASTGATSSSASTSTSAPAPTPAPALPTPAPAPPPAPTPAAPPPSVATAQLEGPKDETEAKIKNLEKGVAGRKKYLAREKKSKEQQITSWKKRNADKPEEEKQEYERKARERLKQLEDELTADIKAKEEEIKQLRSGQKKTAAPPSSPSSSGGGGGGAPAATSSSGGGGSSTPMPSMPSSGTQVAQSSTAVAAASEPKSQGTQVVSTSTSSGPRDGGATSSGAIPSPVADRGSLDIGVFFKPGM